MHVMYFDQIYPGYVTLSEPPSSSPTLNVRGKKYSNGLQVACRLDTEKSPRKTKQYSFCSRTPTETGDPALSSTAYPPCWGKFSKIGNKWKLFYLGKYVSAPLVKLEINSSRGEWIWRFARAG
jgi:hypothetical protein